MDSFNILISSSNSRAGQQRRNIGVNVLFKEMGRWGDAIFNTLGTLIFCIWITSKFPLQPVHQLLKLLSNVVNLRVKDGSWVDHNHIWVNGLFQLAVREKSNI